MKERAPVEAGQVIEYEVTGIAHNGAGVGKWDGFTVFVPFAVPGEKVRARIVQVKKNYALAQLMDILDSHPDRIDPLCPIYMECGGCQIQHVSYQRQLELKRQQVVDSFERIGGLKGVVIHPVLGMDEPWRYRNKVQVPFGWQKGKMVAGFYASGTHEIIDMEQCLIQPSESDKAIRMIKELAHQLGIPPYDEKRHQGVLRHVMVRVGLHTQEMMIVLVTNGEHLPRKKELVQQLRTAFPQVRSIIQNINAKRTNVILGEKNKKLWGDSVIHDRIGDVQFAISPHSFFQVNPVQTEVLYEQVRKYADLTGNETVIDAYCGIGTIALYLAKESRKVYGVEIVPEAIRDAIRNAELNGMKHVHFEVGAAEKVMPRWLKEGIRPDVVVVDPPRKGCQPELLDAVVGMAPERVVYVSCNPATLARDARYLQEKGYIVQEVQPVDMFPQTMHVECVALLTST
ncbi:23S rRNA (uracil(1939)-C(5))-methyltransferase RlmD [Thermoflavimicrobium dichotomicum]|uniref:23S rRNA (Uracil1939-C5)-methyltransferase n=1 Tax=Thermoflavimicrobium dichotomicum TaxID=46223 RepID=A0A1I3RKN1_9BACL|nr:23S rRNA (uracil(1939)-C(5))-methyltransferase RlmD [Thermoflavimicrobium dichotomicum]SFJ45726.1 23S rRNA (uracil1939-C5)-methyltransferase [Thermoflavimicrobium dichotomicum]